VGQAIDLVRKGLLDQGYFVEEKQMRVGRPSLGRRLVPHCERIAAIEGRVATQRISSSLGGELTPTSTPSYCATSELRRGLAAG